LAQAVFYPACGVRRFYICVIQLVCPHPEMAARWGDYDEDDDEGNETLFATKVDDKGIKILVDYHDKDGRTYKVTKKVKQTINTHWTNRGMEARKHLAKFGIPANNDPASEKHLCKQSEEDIQFEFAKRMALQVNSKDEAEDKFYEESLAAGENLNQQKKAWTEINKAKQEAREEEKPETQVTAVPKAGGYVPPSLRGKDGADGKGKGKSDTIISLRVTNLAEDCNSGDLQDLFGSIGRAPSRVHIIRDKETNISRGHAYVNYNSLVDAERAIKMLDGHCYDNLVMRVALAPQRQ